MTPERFRQVEQLAVLALGKDERERAVFLENACSGDADLRRRVEALLAADEKAGDYLATPIVQRIAESLAQTPDESERESGAAALAPGTSVGRYVIEREVGSGGMGVVYVAYDPELGRKVAIKLVRPLPSRRTDPGRGRARLLREAQAMAQLTHPNVAAIHDVGTFRDQVFIAMEYVEGSALREWLSSAPRAWKEILGIFVQCGRALATAHAKSIVHRDFKADNVWVGEDGRARVLDFGLARAMSGVEAEPNDSDAHEIDAQRSSPPLAMLAARVTQPGIVLGTPPYMAPEQLRGEPGDPRSDQFSFCVALHEALYGELPFTATTPAQLLDRMERRTINAPARRSRVPSWLGRVLQRGLSPNPADRYESMEDLLDEVTPRTRIWQRWSLVLVAFVIASAVFVVGRNACDGGATHVASIAVLPLKNLSGDARQDPFVDGMTEALITELGKIGALQVLSYQSTVRYRQTALPLPQIARELRVDAFLEGAMLDSAGKVRITANLIQASPERHLWGETYEFDRRDVLAIQGEVSRAVAGRIRVRVTPSELVRLTTSRRVDSEAYEAYLLGRAHLSKTPTPASWARAKESFEKAIEKDPAYAPAYAGLAELYIRHRSWRDHRDSRREARRWAEKAVALDDTLAEAHTILARCAQQDWDWADVEREFRRAIELNPSHALARIWYSQYLSATLRFDDGVAEARRAQQLDPLSPHVHTWAAYAYFLARSVEEATATLQKALELDPTYSDASMVLARILATRGMHQQSIEELQKALIFNPRQPLLLGALAHAYALTGQREQALKLVADLRRIDVDESGYAPFGLIWAYAGLGDNDLAFSYLERAYQERAGRMVWLNVDPTLEPLRSDPRFEDLVRRVGLPTRKSPHP
jgi:eukaryotic-like serine/threonine-protein kinase